MATTVKTITKAVKKTRKDVESVLKQVYGGVKGDWNELLNGLEGKSSRKRKLARPGK